jgi:hypothetical protein
MDPLSRPAHPLLRAAPVRREPLGPRRHTYLIAVRQADTFLRGRGICLDPASQADLEAFMADLLARRTASTAATYHQVLKTFYGCSPVPVAVSRSACQITRIGHHGTLTEPCGRKSVYLLNLRCSPAPG